MIKMVDEEEAGNEIEGVPLSSVLINGTRVSAEKANRCVERT